MRYTMIVPATSPPKTGRFVINVVILKIITNTSGKKKKRLGREMTPLPTDVSGDIKNTTYPSAPALKTKAKRRSKRLYFFSMSSV